MTVLVGRMPDGSPGQDPAAAIGLGLRLARALGEPLVVCTVLSPGDPPADDPDPAPAADGVDVTVTHIADRSVPGGLARAAHTHQAAAIVVGDGPHRPGTVGARLARAAGLPVVLAGVPDAATGVDAGVPITRVTCAFDGSRSAAGVLSTAADLAARTGAALRVASFAAQRPPAGVGSEVEPDAVEPWREQMLGAQRDAVAGLDVAAETLAVAATTVEDAVTGLGWEDGDLLVVGASAMGAAARVLLGDPAAAILRAAPVPVVLSPGDAAL